MPKLALRGGEPIIKNMKIAKKVFQWPVYDEGDKKALLDVLERRKWCRLYKGSVTEKFEETFAQFQEAKYGVAVANGTVALELALKTLGIGAGDEVLVPASTFIATASAVSEVGAIPVFVDVDPETYQIDPTQIEKSITRRTKGIMVVHYGGYPADLDTILPLVKKYDLFLIEDCAHAHGTEWKGKKVGARGNIGCFSFQESKSLPSGEGGIILTNEEDLVEKAKLIHNIGRIVGRPGYEHYILSSNYRLSEFQAALLLTGMPRLEEQTNHKDRTGKFLAKELAKIEGIKPLKQDSRITKRGYYYFVLRYDKTKFDGISRDRFLEALKAEGIPADKGYGIPLYRQPAFKKENIKKAYPNRFSSFPDYENLYLPAIERICAQEQITLPHQVLLAEEEYLQKIIIEAVVKIKQNIDELHQ